VFQKYNVPCAEAAYVTGYRERNVWQLLLPLLRWVMCVCVCVCVGWAGRQWAGGVCSCPLRRCVPGQQCEMWAGPLRRWRSLPRAASSLSSSFLNSTAIIPITRRSKLSPLSSFELKLRLSTLWAKCSFHKKCVRKAKPCWSRFCWLCSLSSLFI